MESCEDDTQWFACMKEAAAAIMTGRVLRHLFCTILVNCEPTKPVDIFDAFWKDMCDDFLQARQHDLLATEDELDKQAKNDLLIDINKILQQHSKSNEDYGMEMPNEQIHSLPMNNESEIDPDAEGFFNQNHTLLNLDQMKIFNTINDCVDNEEGGLYNFDAPGGCGKLFLSNIIFAYIEMNRKIAIATALSGIVATLLTLGTTLHRRFAAPIPRGAPGTSRLKLNSNEARIRKESCLIMIDEVSMMNFDLLDLLDRFLRVLMEKDLCMGGKLIILMHDLTFEVDSGLSITSNSSSTCLQMSLGANF